MLFGGDVMLGQSVRAKVVKTIGYCDEAGYIYPLNFAQIHGTSNEEYAFILGIDHPVSNFDGRVIAVLEPEDKNKNKIWILAPKSTRYINLDIIKTLNIETDYPAYKLICLYETSSGAIIYRKINDNIRYLLIKNKRSANWGFPKGHLEMGESVTDAAKREVLEETGLHITIHNGFECVSKYKIKDKIDKKVSIFVGTTEDTTTIIQQDEIEDYIWLPFSRAIRHLKFENDKTILKKAHTFLIQNKLIPSRKELFAEDSK